MARGSKWYYNQFEGKNEKENMFTGFFVLVGFIVSMIGFFYLLAELAG